MGRLPDPERAALHRNLDPLLSLLLTTVTAEGKMEGLQGKTITVVHVRWTTDLRLCVRDGSPIYGCACAMDHRSTVVRVRWITDVRARWMSDLRLCVRDGSPIYGCACAMDHRSTVVRGRWVSDLRLSVRDGSRLRRTWNNWVWRCFSWFVDLVEDFGSCPPRGWDCGDRP